MNINAVDCVKISGTSYRLMQHRTPADVTYLKILDLLISKTSSHFLFHDQVKV